MSSSPDVLHDGNFTAAIPIGAPRSQFPFLINGDRITEFFEQDYWQSCGNFVPEKFGIVHPIRSDFYLGKETPPQPIQIGANLVGFTRTWFRIPSSQTQLSSKYVTKPDISVSSSQFGSVQDLTPLIGAAGFVASYAFGASQFIKPYFYPVKLATSSQAAATGGTFTLTYKASTTGALAYNAAEATIATALNGLASSIADGITWTVNVNALFAISQQSQVLILLNNKGAISPVTANFSSITCTGPKVGFTKNQGYAMFIYLARKAVIPAHGFDTTKDLIVMTNSGFGQKLGGSASSSPGWSSVDADTVAFYHTTGPAADYTLFMQQGGSYSPGTTNSRIKRITDFFWPGVTPGINSADDIPLATNQGDANSIIAAVLAGTTSINLEVGELTNWMDSPILARSRVTTDASKL